MENNYCVIMSGGIGSRFWPVSRESKPKQFLDILGTGKTLLRLTVDRFAKLIPIQNFVIVTSEEYFTMTCKEIPEFSPSQILIEPERKNTAMCVAYASFYIQSLNPNANIVVTPADHIVLDQIEFHNIINKSFEFVNKDNTLLTIGITPTRPDTGYGYIEVKSIDLMFSPVSSFREKPNLELARTFVGKPNFLWNSGIFIWTANAIIQSIRLFLPNIYEEFYNYFSQNDRTISSIYKSARNVSIDYGIMEKADNVCVIKGDFGWSDIGTWGAVYNLLKTDKDPNVVVGGRTLFLDSHRNIVNINSDMLVVVKGIDDSIIVESNKVLLICAKEEEQNIKHIIAEVKEKFGDQYI